MEPNDVLYVRLRRVGPNQQRPGRYTIGQVTFEYDHNGWYEVSAQFGDGLRRKRANELNRNRSLPLFEVMTYEEVLNLERAERAAAEVERHRQDKLFAGERVSSAIPMGALRARRVGSLLDDGSRAASTQVRAATDEAPQRRVELAEEVVSMKPSQSDDWDDDEQREGGGISLVDKPVDPPPSASGPSSSPSPTRRPPPRTAEGRRIRQGGTSDRG